MTKEVIALDPSYAQAYAILGYTHFMDVIFRSSKSPRQSFGRAMELAQKAIALDDSLSTPHALLGYVYTFTRQHEKGIAESERTVELSPNDLLALRALGIALRFAGRWEEAIPVYEKAIRINPFPDSAVFWHLGMAYLFSGRSEEGIAACKKAVDANPNDLLAHIALTVAYSDSGREEEARAEVKEALRIDPNFSLERYERQALRYKNKAYVETLVSALRKAGLPE